MLRRTERAPRAFPCAGERQTTMKKQKLIDGTRWHRTNWFWLGGVNYRLVELFLFMRKRISVCYGRWRRCTGEEREGRDLDKAPGCRLIVSKMRFFCFDLGKTWSSSSTMFGISCFEQIEIIPGKFDCTGCPSENSQHLSVFILEIE